MKIMILVAILLSSSVCIAMTKEQIAEIERKNAQAMSNIYANPNQHINKEEGEAENEVVTDKDFKKVQKERKEKAKRYAHYKPIPASASLLKGTAKAGDKFRMHIDGPKISNAKPDGKSFTFAYYDNEPAFQHSGYGFYAIKCDVISCLKEGYFEEETYVANDAKGTFKTHEVLKVNGFEAVVEYTGAAQEAINSSGQKHVLPVLKVVEAY